MLLHTDNHGGGIFVAAHVTDFASARTAWRWRRSARRELPAAVGLVFAKAMPFIGSGASAGFGSGAMVVGPAPVGDQRQMDRIIDLTDQFTGVCAEAAVPFVNVSESLIRSETWLEEIAASDEAHPAAAGYEELARIVLDSGWLGWVEAEASV